jgi:hypothetical protein
LKILIVDMTVHESLIGGGHLYLHAIMKRLRQKRHEVHLAVSGKPHERVAGLFRIPARWFTNILRRINLGRVTVMKDYLGHMLREIEKLPDARTTSGHSIHNYLNYSQALPAVEFLYNDGGVILHFLLKRITQITRKAT